MNDKIQAYKDRRYNRICDRAKLNDANEKTNFDDKLPYGLCKKYGIELPEGATPRDAWNALKDKKGITPESAYADRFTPGGESKKPAQTQTESKLKAKIFVINKGTPSQEFRLKDAEDGTVWSHAPTWKSEKGARRWAIKNGLDIVD